MHKDVRMPSKTDRRIGPHSHTLWAKRNNSWITNLLSTQCKKGAIRGSGWSFYRKNPHETMLVLHTKRVHGGKNLGVCHSIKSSSVILPLFSTVEKVTSFVDFWKTPNEHGYLSYKACSEIDDDCRFHCKPNMPRASLNRTCQLSGCKYWQISLFILAGFN